MQVQEVMCKNVKVIQPDATLEEAAKLMQELECGYLPIGENDRLQGAVTDRDIVIRAIAEGKDPSSATVKEVMTGKIEFCFEEDNIEDAARQMKEKQIRRLVVLNKDKRLIGVLSIGDIARECGDKHMTGDIETGVAKAA